MCEMWQDLYGHVAAGKYQKRLDEAAEERLARLATAQNATSLQRFSMWLGDVLVNTGYWLRRRSRERQAQIYAAMMPRESRMEY